MILLLCSRVHLNFYYNFESHKLNYNTKIGEIVSLNACSYRHTPLMNIVRINNLSYKDTLHTDVYKNNL